MTDLTAANAAITELRHVLDWLAANLLPGTAKPYRTPQLSTEKRAERDAEARLERLERVGIAPGESPVPLDLDVADLLAEIMATADDLADRVALAAWRPVGAPAGSAFADPSPCLDVIVAALPVAAVRDPGLPGLIEGRCDGLIYRAHRLLGLLGDGQLLNAVCPWCGGRTSGAPVGGAKTMRVRAQLPPGRRSVTQVDPKDVRWFVVCESGLC